jgi:HD-like signal output (HDOD) protein
MIGRTVGLQARLASETLVAFAGSLRRIPSMPRIYAELQSITADPNFDLDQIAAVIRRDPGLAIKTLQVVNSAFYGLREPVSDLSHAVGLLGSKAIASLVLGISMHDQFSVLGAGRRVLDEEWQRALTVAAGARGVATAERASRPVVETAYTAGLLHNAGRLVLAANFADRFGSLDWPEDHGERLDLERTVFGAAHPELGALLLGTWGLEDDLVEAVAFQAEPGQSMGTKFSPLSALHVALGLSSGGASLLDESYLGRLGLMPDPSHLHTAQD